MVTFATAACCLERTALRIIRKPGLGIAWEKQSNHLAITYDHPTWAAWRRRWEGRSDRRLWRWVRRGRRLWP
eukprot:5297542-Pyramimonas_sp.AAC.1